MTEQRYWKLIDSDRNDYTQTFEHVLPHGVLIRVATSKIDGCAEAIVFVPNPPSTEPYR